MTRGWGTCILLALTAPGAAAPGTPALQSSTGGVTVRLAHIRCVREASLTFAAGSPASASRQAATRVVLDFALGARDPDALDAVSLGEVTGDAPWIARDDRGRPATAVRAEVYVQDDRPRLRITAEGLHPNARTLTSLRGSLSAYPDARRIRFHIPWLKDEIPVTVAVQGGVATLRRFRLVGADSTLWVSIQPPDGFQLAPTTQPGALSARAVDIDGNLVNGGGVAEWEQTATAPNAEFRFHCPNLRRTPSRLMLDVLCVSGRSRPLPVRFTHVRLPVAP